ncbi:MAG: hypothetical protein M0C28_14475 [Candidatus Moduliflexus flocculans]|nr:hypothetical protein [Candidatus Moduliflexus flocculans]
MNFATQGDAIYASFEFVLRLEDGRGPDDPRDGRRDPAADQPRAVQGPRTPALLLPGPAGGRPRRIPGPVPAQEQDGQGLLVLRDADLRAARRSVRPAGARRAASRLLPERRPRGPEEEPQGLRLRRPGSISSAPATSSPRPRPSSLSSRPGATPAPRPGPGLRSSSTLVSLDTGESSGTFPLTEAAADPGDASTLLVSGSAPLKDVRPGYYRAEVSARDADGQVARSRRTRISSSCPSPSPSSPGSTGGCTGRSPVPSTSRSSAPSTSSKGSTASPARSWKRSSRNREDPAARLLLAKVALRPGALQGIARPGRPALRARRRPGGGQGGRPGPRRPEGLERGPDRISSDSSAEATEVPVLNLAAECHLALGQPEEALPLIQKSLALAPDQPAVKAMEEQAKKRIESTIGVIDDIQESRMSSSFSSLAVRRLGLAPVPGQDHRTSPRSGRESRRKGRGEHRLAENLVRPLRAQDGQGRPLPPDRA